MKIIPTMSVEPQTPAEDVEGVQVRWIIDKSIGAPNFAMRHFEIAPGGHTPHHGHDFEHVIKVEKGKGIAVDEKGEELSLEEGQSAFVPANSTHQFRNPFGEPFEFLCIIPNPEKKG